MALGTGGIRLTGPKSTHRKLRVLLQGRTRTKPPWPVPVLGSHDARKAIIAGVWVAQKVSLCPPGASKTSPAGSRVATLARHRVIMPFPDHEKCSMAEPRLPGAPNPYVCWVRHVATLAYVIAKRVRFPVDSSVRGFSGLNPTTPDLST